MSSSLSVVRGAFPWGTDESGLEADADGASMTGVTEGPGAGIARTGLSGRNTLIGASSGEVIGCRWMVMLDVEV